MEKIAVVGTGIAGLASAYFLKSRAEITLFEQNDYAGGHTHTVTVQEAGRPVPIDTGFMVYNEITYPNLTRFFKEIGIASQPTSMSFSVQHIPSGLEYCGSSWTQLFAQRKNLFNPGFIAMLYQIDRFNRDAVKTLADPRYESYTLGRYVEEKKYGERFLNQYLVPMSSAVWSTPPGLMLDFPAVTLLRFFHNHGFLGMHTQHPWLTVRGGAKSYVEKLASAWKHKLNLKKKVARVTRENSRVKITSDNGESEVFDKAILACHADQSLEILENPTQEEKNLLRPFQYQSNPAILHTDSAVMPRSKRAWASWNYRIESEIAAPPSTHYWMNSLQNVSQNENYFVSLNYENVAPSKVIRKINFHHPLFGLSAIRAQKGLPSLNRRQNPGVYFCGSYFKYGFHEDAFTSALDLARVLCREPLWN